MAETLFEDQLRESYAENFGRSAASVGKVAEVVWRSARRGKHKEQEDEGFLDAVEAGAKARANELWYKMVRRFRPTRFR